MKKTCIIGLVVVLAALLSAKTPMAQSTMSRECMIKYSTYHEYVKKKYYREAYPYWQVAFRDCPDATKTIYTEGYKILKHLIKEAKTPERRELLLDSLMIVHDQRIEYFGDDSRYPKGYILGLKGIDLFNYSQGDIDKVKKAYQFLSESIESRKSRSLSAVIDAYMRASSFLYKKNEIAAEQVVADFIKTSDILKKQRSEASDKIKLEKYYWFITQVDSFNTIIAELNEDKVKNRREIIVKQRELVNFKRDNKILYSLNLSETALRNVEIIFTESGAATCEILTEVFSPQFNEKGDDIAFLKKLTTILDKNKCSDTELFAQASEKLYELEPSSLAAYNIAKLFVRKDEYEKAKEYYNNAIENEKDDLAKARYYYELAFVNFKLKEYAKARSNAIEAIKRNRDWGKPYLIIAMAYASSSQQCASANNLDGQAVFWIAVDKCYKAKRVDPTISEEATTLINTYSSHFPDNEDAFFHGFTNGDKYKIGCWINETTTVRTIKR